MKFRRPFWVLAAVAVAALVALGAAACHDDVPTVDVLFSKGANCDPAKKNYFKKKNCLLPPPPPVTVEPSFSGPAVAFERPVRLATTSSGWLLVSDWNAQAVLRVDPSTLEPDQALRIEGNPSAVGMLNDQVFVGNVSTHTVEVYTNRGYRTGSLGEPGTAGWPADLAVDSVLGVVFVLDLAALEVKVYEVADGSQIGTIGAGSLVAPLGLAVDPRTEEVFVSDRGERGGKASVKVFGYDDTFHEAVSHSGSCGFFGCSGGFSSPSAVALDSLGRVYLTDMMLAAVLVYDRSVSLLEPVRTLGGRDAEAPAPQLAFPMDLGIRGTSVIVVSQRSRRVDAFPAGVQ